MTKTKTRARDKTKEVVEVEIGTDAPRAHNVVPLEAGGDILGLVRLAIEKGDVGVDVIERLVALQERVSDRAAAAALFEAMSDFQDECPRIAKSRNARIATKKGAKYNYTYASLDDIEKVIRPVLRKYRLSYTWDSVSGENSIKVTCTVRHVEGASVEGSFTCPTESPMKSSEAQKHGAALTYGRRQSLVSVLGLTTTDDDTDAAEPRSMEPITDEQLADLEALVAEVKPDAEKFLAYLGIDSLATLPAVDYAAAVTALEEKRKRNEE